MAETVNAAPGGFFNLRFNMLGEDQINRGILAIAERLHDASPAFEAMGDRLAHVEAEQFETEGKNSGGWVALSGRYAAWKERHYPGRGILERTGDLREALTSRPFGIDEGDGQTHVFGTDLPYAQYHQSGTDRMPQRRPMELPDDERDAWVKIIQRFSIYGDVAGGFS